MIFFYQHNVYVNTLFREDNPVNCNVSTTNLLAVFKVSHLIDYFVCAYIWNIKQNSPVYKTSTDVIIYQSVLNSRCLLTTVGRKLAEPFGKWSDDVGLHT